MNSDRISIVSNRDGTVDVTINGEAELEIPTTNIDSNIHAVQWYGDKGVGEVEYMDHNEEIDDFTPFEAILTDCKKEVDRRHDEDIQRALDMEPSEEEKDRMDRDDLLFESDWVSIKYSDLGQPMPQEWAEYRQALRDITLQDGFPGNVEWPEEPATKP